MIENLVVRFGQGRAQQGVNVNEYLTHLLINI